MSVFSKIRGFFSRHRNKFVVGGVLITGAAFLTSYTQRKIKEWQENEMKEFLDRTRKQQHFESILRTCNFTILNLHGTLLQAVSKAVNTDSIIADLRDRRGDQVELWNLLKIMVFCKIGTIVYMTTVLVITLRVQLNLIGGHLFKNASSLPGTAQESYLSKNQSLLLDSINEVSNLVKEKCNKVLGTIELKRPMKLSDIEAVFWSIQTAVATDDRNPMTNMKKFIDPHTRNDSSATISSIAMDTMDLLDSDDVKKIAIQSVNRGFALLLDNLSEFYSINGTKPVEATISEFSNILESKKPMAKVLPILSGLTNKTSFPSKYVNDLIANEPLQVLGANIYESLL